MQELSPPQGLLYSMSVEKKPAQRHVFRSILNSKNTYWEKLC